MIKKKLRVSPGSWLPFVASVFALITAASFAVYLRVTMEQARFVPRILNPQVDIDSKAIDTLSLVGWGLMFGGIVLMTLFLWFAAKKKLGLMALPPLLYVVGAVLSDWNAINTANAFGTERWVILGSIIVVSWLCLMIMTNTISAKEPLIIVSFLALAAMVVLTFLQREPFVISDSCFTAKNCLDLSRLVQVAGYFFTVLVFSLSLTNSYQAEVSGVADGDRKAPAKGAEDRPAGRKSGGAEPKSDGKTVNWALLRPTEETAKKDTTPVEEVAEEAEVAETVTEAAVDSLEGIDDVDEANRRIAEMTANAPTFEEEMNLVGEIGERKDQAAGAAESAKEPQVISAEPGVEVVQYSAPAEEESSGEEKTLAQLLAERGLLNRTGDPVAQADARKAEIAAGTAYDSFFNAAAEREKAEAEAKAAAEAKKADGPVAEVFGSGLDEADGAVDEVVDAAVSNEAEVIGDVAEAAADTIEEATDSAADVAEDIAAAEAATAETAAEVAGAAAAAAAAAAGATAFSKAGRKTVYDDLQEQFNDTADEAADEGATAFAAKGKGAKANRTREAAAKVAGDEPVLTVPVTPVSGSKLQKILKEEVITDRDQKLMYRRKVSVFAVIGMCLSVAALVVGALTTFDVVKIDMLKDENSCLMLLGLGLVMFLVFGTRLTYKDYYTKTVVNERKVVHEESNWEEYVANRLEEDEKNIAALAENYMRMTEMYGRLLETTAELTNNIKALSMRQQASIEAAPEPAAEKFTAAEPGVTFAEEPAAAETVDEFTEEIAEGSGIELIAEPVVEAFVPYTEPTVEAAPIEEPIAEAAPIEEVIEKAVEEPITEAFAPVEETAEEVTETAEAVEAVAEETAEAAEAVAEETAEAVESAAEEVTDTAEETIAEAVAPIEETVEAAAEETAETVEAVAEETAEAVEAVAEETTEAAESATEEVAEAAEETIAEAVAPAEEAVEKAVETVEETVEKTEEPKTDGASANASILAALFSGRNKKQPAADTVTKETETEEAQTEKEAPAEEQPAAEEPAKQEEAAEEPKPTGSYNDFLISTLFGRKKDKPAREVEEPVAEAVEAVEEVTTEATEATEAVEEVAETAEETVAEAVEEVATEATEAVEEITEATEEIPEAIEEVTTEATETVEEVAAEATEAVEETVEEIAEATEEIPEAIEEVTTEATEAVEEVAAEAAEVTDSIPITADEAASEFNNMFEEATDEFAAEGRSEVAEAIENITEASQEAVPDYIAAPQGTTSEAVKAVTDSIQEPTWRIPSPVFGAFGYGATLAEEEEPESESGDTMKLQFSSNSIEEPMFNDAPMQNVFAPQSVTEETPVEEFTAAEPFTAEEPAVEETPFEDFTAAEPFTAEEPAVEETPFEDFTVEEPVVEETPIEDFTVEEPVAEEPVAEAAPEEPEEKPMASVPEWKPATEEKKAPFYRPSIYGEDSIEDAVNNEEMPKVNIPQQRDSEPEKQDDGIIEGFVMPTFRGFTYSDDVEQEPTDNDAEEQMYNGSYKMKSFLARKTSQNEQMQQYLYDSDDDDDFSIQTDDSAGSLYHGAEIPEPVAAEDDGMFAEPELPMTEADFAEPDLPETEADFAEPELSATESGAWTDDIGLPTWKPNMPEADEAIAEEAPYTPPYTAPYSTPYTPPYMADTEPVESAAPAAPEAAPEEPETGRPPMFGRKMNHPGAMVFDDDPFLDDPLGDGMGAANAAAQVEETEEDARAKVENRRKMIQDKLEQIRKKNQAMQFDDLSDLDDEGVFFNKK
ncbi:MAG: hypothetical protein J6Y26_04880 [Lachnospiraceae bacterium]|nr:hypothetical protein [Lachnospiraceae bacterium]